MCRRPFARLVTFAAGISAVLWVAVIVLWVRGYRRNTQVRWDARGTRYWLDSSPGGWTAHATYEPGRGQDSSVDVPRIELDPSDAVGPTVRIPGQAVRRFTAPGLVVETGYEDGGVLLIGGLPVPPSVDTDETYAEVRVRAWLVALLTGAVPAAWAWRRWRSDGLARRPGCCVTCGYDLRATPDGCPECGAGRVTTPAVERVARGRIGES